MNVNYTAIAIVAFLMSGIYFSAYMVYGESSDWENFEGLREGQMSQSTLEKLSNETTLMNFDVWINNIYLLAKTDIGKIHGTPTPFSAYILGAFEAEQSWIINTYNIIKLDYHWGAGSNLFDKYNTGYNWWANSPYLSEQTILYIPISNYRYDIKYVWYEDYKYSHARGDEVETFLEGNPLVEPISGWVGKATKGANVAWSMLTLNIIPDGETGMPAIIKSAMLIFLIPMWIIFLIAIAPLLLRLGELILQGIDIIVPDWL